MLVGFWRDRRPPATDVAVAAVFVLLGQLVTWGQLEEPASFTGPRVENAVLNLLLMGALAWRRSAPLEALCWAVAVYFLPHALVPHDMTFLAAAMPLIVLTASAGYHCAPGRALLAAALAVLALGVVTATTPELRSVDAAVVNAVFVLAPWLAARGLRQREDRAAELAAALATERGAREVALRDAVVAERAHIARELHDIVAHSVSMMVIQVGAARVQLRPESAATAPLRNAEDAGRQALQDLRRLLGVLRTDELLDPPGAAAGAPQAPQPGLSQLDTLVLPLRAAGLQVEVAVSGEATSLPAALDLTAYRIVQEALTNVLKHSGARRVSVHLGYGRGVLLLEVADDGGPARSSDGSGQGLAGIRERVALFGGVVTAGPAAPAGWRVRAELPRPASLPDQRTAALPTP